MKVTRESPEYRPALGVLLLVVLGVSGCNDHGPTATVTTMSSSPSLVVSAPVLLSPSSSATPPRNAGGGFEAVFVALLPGTAPSGISASIRNRTRGVSASAFLSAGGFDPVAVAAGAGDTLDLTVYAEDGRTVLRTEAVVVAIRRPIVVRTLPPPRRRDVPLNTIMIVVFSEPVMPGSVNGRSLQLLGPSGPVPGRITISPDGLRAAFEPDQLLGATSSYTLQLTDSITDVGGARLEPLALDFTTAVTDPAAGMSRIAFSSCSGYGTTDQSCRVAVMNADGSAVSPLGPSPTAGDWDGSPAWSPDGQKLAFSSYRHCLLTNRLTPAQGGDCQREIYVIYADGSGITRLTTLEQSDGLRSDFPAWSPDGRSIAFTKAKVNVSDLYIMNADGSGLRALNGPPQYSYGRPAWSPDGTKLAFSRSTSGVLSSQDTTKGIYLANADGSQPARLSTESDGFAAWSPDGAWIAFQRQWQPDSAHIMIARTDGTQLTQLTHGPGLYLTPSWSPDGSRIALKFTPGGLQSSLWVMRSDGTGLTLLDPGWANLPAWSPIGSVPAALALPPHRPFPIP